MHPVRPNLRTPPPPEQAMATLLEVRWDISLGAFLAADSVRTLLNGHAAALARVALAIRVEHDCAIHAFLVLSQRGRGVDHPPLSLSLSTPRPHARIVQDSRFLHLDAPGLLSASLHTDISPPRLAFATSPLLEAALHLPGGVYDAPTLTSLDLRAFPAHFHTLVPVGRGVAADA